MSFFNCRDTGGQPKCPIDPFFIVPDKCKCVDFQVLRLQEAPEAVPNGELPRHLQLYCDRYLCERVVPGNRVTVVGIYSIKKSAKPSVPCFASALQELFQVLTAHFSH